MWQLWKAIGRLRKQNAGSEPGMTVRCLKLLTQLLIFLVLVVVSIRFAVALWLNFQVANFVPLMRANGDRLEGMGLIARGMELLMLLYPIPGVAVPPANVAFRETRHNYSEMLKHYGVSTSRTTYQEFAIEQLKYGIRRLHQAQIYINNHLDIFDQSAKDIINPPKVEIATATGETTSVSYRMSIESTVGREIAAAHRLIYEVENRLYNLRESGVWVEMHNLMVAVTNALRNCLDAIVNEGYKRVQLQESYSNSLIIVLLVLYLAYFLILIPFLYAASYELEKMLALLLDIKHIDIKRQTDAIHAFLCKLLYNSDFKDSLRKETAIHALDNVEDDQAELLLQKTPFESQAAIRSSLKRTKGHYSSRIWHVLILFAMFSAIELSVFYILDYVSKQTCERLAFKITELRRLSRTIYCNAYNMPYISHFIRTNKTGYCGLSLCAKYLNVFYSLRMTEVNDILTMHQAKAYLLSEEDNRLFSNLMEHNPCETTELGHIPYCSTMMGGIIAKGGYAANIKHLDETYSVYKDFMRCQGTAEEITSYLNDPRLIDIEALNLLLLNPLMKIMEKHIETTMPHDIGNATLKAGLLFCSFVLANLISTFCWLRWLVYSLHGTVSCTKALLFHIPSDVIEHTQPILDYFYAITECDHALLPHS